MRALLAGLTLLGLLPLMAMAAENSPAPAGNSAAPVALHLLDGAAPTEAGVAWGVPYARGQIAKDAHFALAAAGKPLPLQNWPLAYWPDGSIKWMGFATTVSPARGDNFTLTPAAAGPSAATQPALAVHVTQNNVGIDIDTGGAQGIQCHITPDTANLFDTLVIAGHTVAVDAHLEMILQHGPDADPTTAAPPPAREHFTSLVKSVTVEQAGPVRAVVKFQGMYKADDGPRQFLPFTVRLYFYAGQTPVRMVHTFFYDGNEHEDFIRGMGITASVPFREEIQNRHVRFAGAGNGLWAEPIEPALGYQGGVRYPNGGSVYPDQVAGKRIPNRADLDPRSQHLLDAWATWSDFRLIQSNPNGFTIQKRTNPESTWLNVNTGTRASGLAFIGDVSGGLGIGVKDFWQSYPAALDIRGATSKQATLTAWLWSPYGPAMDMRHYDTRAHGLNESYEDVQPGLSTPYGVGRTSELTLFPTSDVPAATAFAAMSTINKAPPQIVATPQYLHDMRAFGIWSLKDTSTPFKKAVEAQLDAELAYYQKAVDQWSWYGFWYYGNVMHSYDMVRHEWRYDIGGFAWDNNEQGTNMWLWYSFLRSGRPDLFRLAEAMSRQTQEVECYHIGPLAGLGSRHNVIPWGDGAKEARISMAPYGRFYYYLTTDERTGDAMHETLQAETAITHIDPMREVIPPTPEDKKYPARVRAGPDWFAFAGDWMTEWERTGNTKYRDKILESARSIQAMPYWFRTSQDLLWRFYPKTGKLLPRTLNAGGYNLVQNMGGPEVMMELNDMLDDPAWTRIYLQYCRLTDAPADVLKKDQQTGTEGADARYAGGGRLAGYAYYLTHDPAYAKKAIGAISLGGGNYSSGSRDLSKMNHLVGPEVLKPTDEAVNGDGIITNGINQSSLNTIEVLELCKDQLPTAVPPPTQRGRRGGFRGRGRGRGARGGR